MSYTGEKLGNIVSAFLSSREYREYSKYHERNLFGITKVSRMELMHSNFLAWLFDSAESHNLGVFPSQKLLVAIAKAKNRNKEIGRLPDKLFFPFLTESFGIVASRVFREETFYVEGKKRSIDLIIEIRTEDNRLLPIIIENKVNSHEHTDQTKDYFIEAERRYSKSEKEYPPIFLFLVPMYNVSNATEASFITITYQDLVDYVLEPCMYKTDDDTISSYIRTYLQCLSFQSDNEKGNQIMAISKEEQRILQTFLNNNRNFLNSLIEIMKESEDYEKEDLDKLQNTLNSRDYSKYIFEGNEYNKSKLVHAVVRTFIDTKKPSFSELLDYFPKELQGSKGVVSKLGDVKENERNRFYCSDDMILSCCDGTQVVTCTQWGIDNIDRFIKQANGLGFVISKK